MRALVIYFVDNATNKKISERLCSLYLQVEYMGERSFFNLAYHFQQSMLCLHAYAITNVSQTLFVNIDYDSCFYTQSLFNVFHYAEMDYARWGESLLNQK